jgi:hypothetical protein
MHGPTPSERLRRSLWNAIAEDSWAQADLDAAVSGYVAEARERGATLVEICRSLRVHVQQVGLGLTADRYETVARHVEALAETAYRGVFRGRHSSRTVDVPSSGEES